MNTTVLPIPRRVNWVCIQRIFTWGTAFAFTFAMGGWVTSIRVQEASLPYLQRSTLKEEQVEKVAGKNPVATLKCLHKKADVAEAQVQKSESGQDVDTSKIPECPPLPAEKRSIPH